MTPEPPSYYAIRYQPHPQLLIGMVLRPLSAVEFTESCEVLLAWAQHHQCPFWLIDGRADVVKPFDVYDWLQDEFLPRLQQVLNRVPCLAVIARPELWQVLQANSYAPPAPSIRSGASRTNWFTEEETALAWLTQFRPASGYHEITYCI